MIWSWEYSGASVREAGITHALFLVPVLVHARGISKLSQRRNFVVRSLSELEQNSSASALKLAGQRPGACLASMFNHDLTMRQEIKSDCQEATCLHTTADRLRWAYSSCFPQTWNTVQRSRRRCPCHPASCCHTNCEYAQRRELWDQFPSPTRPKASQSTVKKRKEQTVVLAREE